jgi:hypothetical protein
MNSIRVLLDDCAENQYIHTVGSHVSFGNSYSSGPMGRKILSARATFEVVKERLGATGSLYQYLGRLESIWEAQGTSTPLGESFHVHRTPTSRVHLAMKLTKRSERAPFTFLNER